MRKCITVNKALSDAKLQYSDVEQAAVGYIYGGTCCGQRALYEIGFTGIPIYNVSYLFQLITYWYLKKSLIMVN